MKQKDGIPFLTRPPIGYVKGFLHQLEELVFLYAICEDEMKQEKSS